MIIVDKRVTNGSTNSPTCGSSDPVALLKATNGRKRTILCLSFFPNPDFCVTGDFNVRVARGGGGEVWDFSLWLNISTGGQLIILKIVALSLFYDIPIIYFNFSVLS